MQNLKQNTNQITEQGEKRIGFGDATVHELKTLLTAIIVSAELLADELQMYQKSMSLRLTQNIIRNAHSLDEKLTNFSEMAGLLAGDFSFQPEQIEIEPVIHSVTAQLYPITKSKKQSLAVELPASLPPVKSHRQYLEQILLNLLTNASKFTPEGGKITVSASQNDKSLVIEVADNGMGIPADKQELIFQPYYQVNGGRGSGLGLAITKLLVELHGGKIWLESGSGQGSHFFFSLPL
ncbi:MAG: HAMP domain-containing histidine kinase [Dehalococcoidia bacterium]|nr:MAG: HAMP domain-containing histidine kinase [Dehalococcoidia bacterium]